MAFSKIGIIGTGVIGESLIDVLLRSGLSKDSLFIAEKRGERRDEIIKKYGVKELDQRLLLDAVLIAVKPQDFLTTIKELPSSPDAYWSCVDGGKEWQRTSNT
jgi:pyrroline-5-carboxylate reductase